MKIMQKFKDFYKRRNLKRQDRKDSKNRNGYHDDMDEIYHPCSLAQRPPEAVEQVVDIKFKDS